MSGIRFDPQGMLSGMAEMELKMKAAVGVYGGVAAKKLEADAKKDAPWEDRTGRARQSIKGESKWSGAKMRIGVSGNTDYFPYLEYAKEKRFAALHPTVQRKSPEIVEGLHNLLGK